MGTKYTKLLQKLAAPKWAKMLMKLGPKAQQRLLSTDLPQRFIKPLGSGAMHQADLMAGAAFGRRGFRVRKTPYRDVDDSRFGSLYDRDLLDDVAKQITFADDVRRVSKGRGQFAQLQGRRGLVSYYDYAPEPSRVTSKSQRESLLRRGVKFPIDRRNELGSYTQGVLNRLEKGYPGLFDVRDANIAGDARKGGRIVDFAWSGPRYNDSNFAHQARHNIPLWTGLYPKLPSERVPITPLQLNRLRYNEFINDRRNYQNRFDLSGRLLRTPRDVSQAINRAAVPITREFNQVGVDIVPPGSPIIAKRKVNPFAPTALDRTPPDSPTIAKRKVNPFAPTAAPGGRVPTLTQPPPVKKPRYKPPAPKRGLLGNTTVPKP